MFGEIVDESRVFDGADAVAEALRAEQLDGVPDAFRTERLAGVDAQTQSRLPGLLVDGREGSGGEQVLGAAEGDADPVAGAQREQLVEEDSGCFVAGVADEIDDPAKARPGPLGRLVDEFAEALERKLRAEQVLGGREGELGVFDVFVGEGAANAQSQSPQIVEFPQEERREEVGRQETLEALETIEVRGAAAAGEDGGEVVMPAKKLEMAGQGVAQGEIDAVLADEVVEEVGGHGADEVQMQFGLGRLAETLDHEPRLALEPRRIAPGKLTNVSWVRQRGRRTARLALRAAALWLAGAVCLLGQDPFAGVWADGPLTLSLEGDGSDYSGVIEFDGLAYPTEAFYDGNTIDGSFESQGDEFFYRGYIKDGLLFFETGGTTYRLVKRSSRPKSANPLARNPHKQEESGEEPLGAEEAVGEQSLGQQADAPLAGDGLTGPYRLDLPEGWSTEPDPTAGVALIPPEAAPDNQEVYAITHLPNISGPEDPRAAAMLQQMLGPAALTATYRLEELAVAGRTVILHAFGLAELGRRLHAYLSLSNGETLAVMASGLDEIVERREAVIREIAGTAEYVGRAAGPAASQAPMRPGRQPGMMQPGVMQPQPAVQPGMIQTHPDAPPIQPGQLSDGKPQSLQWLQHLNGRLLTVMESYSSGTAGGYSSQDRTLLYPNGRFDNYSSSSVSADVPGASAGAGGQERMSGSWRVISANGSSFLAVVADGARQEVYLQLVMQNGQTFVDGKRVYVTVPQ